MKSGVYMRFVIVCLIKGEALKYHEKCVSDVCFKYKVSAQKLPAHFTIKAPFETDNIYEIENIVQNFVDLRHKENITIDGIGHFGFSTIYMNINLNDSALELYKDFIHELKKLDFLEWRGPHDGQGKNLHATIVTHLNEEKFNEIWDYVKLKYDPKFNLCFDNISILKWDKYKWVTYKQFILK